MLNIYKHNSSFPYCLYVCIVVSLCLMLLFSLVVSFIFTYLERCQNGQNGIYVVYSVCGSLQLLNFLYASILLKGKSQWYNSHRCHQLPLSLESFLGKAFSLTKLFLKDILVSCVRCCLCIHPSIHPIV